MKIYMFWGARLRILVQLIFGHLALPQKFSLIIPHIRIIVTLLKWPGYLKVFFFFFANQWNWLSTLMIFCAFGLFWIFIIDDFAICLCLSCPSLKLSDQVLNFNLPPLTLLCFQNFAMDFKNLCSERNLNITLKRGLDFFFFNFLYKVRISE